MSQTEINKLFSIVMALHGTVQNLVEKVEGSAQRNGTALVNENCNDAGESAERNKNRQGCVDVVEIDKGALGKSGVVNGESSVANDGRAQGLLDSDGTVLAGIGVPITFGGFQGSVPVDSGGRKGVVDIGTVGSVVVSNLTESDSGSWSDMVEEELEQARSSEAVGSVASGVNFFRDFVRTSDVRNLRDFIGARGVLIRKSLFEELALSRYTAGTVPSAFVEGRARLKTLAVVGDKAMSLAATDSMYRAGRSSAAVQEFLSRVLTRTALSPVCVGSGLSKHISVATGVDIGKTSVGGEALEAVFGVVFHSGGLESVAMLMRSMQLL